MKRLSTFRKAALVLVVVAAAIAGWLMWTKLNQPVYASSHSHSEQGHAHMHTHGGDLDHGHEHLGSSGPRTHSHPHQHQHQHSSSTGLADAAGLTEVGHLHRESGTRIFLAKAEVTEKTVELDFFRQDSDAEMPVDYEPDSPTLSVQLFNGSSFEGKLKVELTDERFIGELPDDFFCLPTHTLKIRSLKLGGEEFEAVIPLTRIARQDEQE